MLELETLETGTDALIFVVVATTAGILVDAEETRLAMPDLFAVAAGVAVIALVASVGALVVTAVVLVAVAEAGEAVVLAPLLAAVDRNGDGARSAFNLAGESPLSWAMEELFLAPGDADRSAARPRVGDNPLSVEGCVVAVFLRDERGEEGVLDAVGVLG